MMKQNYYDLLEIKATAGPEEIKRAYRRLAHRYHPDKNPGNPAAEEHFKRITEAYEVLQNNRKRADYDRFGGRKERRGFEDDRAPFASPFGAPFRKETIEDFLGEMFKDLFGDPRPRSRQNRGADLRLNLELSLEEAAFGSEQTIRFFRNSICPQCQGSGCSPGTAPLICPVCRGVGARRVQRGFFMVESTCSRCRGNGHIILQSCSACGGNGFVKIRREMEMQIPPGVQDGTRLKVHGEGEINAHGGKAGDLNVVVSIRKHSLFDRVGRDLFCEVPVTLLEALVGAEVEIPTLKGRIRMKIPAGLSSGKLFVVKGEGMPHLQEAGRGDLKVRIRLKIPSRLSRQEQETLDEFKRTKRKGHEDFLREVQSRIHS
jgi:molecular chaperone DnaJ